MDYNCRIIILGQLNVHPKSRKIIENPVESEADVEKTRNKYRERERGIM